MEQQPPKRRRIRLWPAVVFLLVLILATIALPIYEGKRHQRIAEKLNVSSNEVYSSHYEYVTIPDPPDSAWHPGSGRIMKTKSTLPEFIEKSGLSVMFRRIELVRIHYTADLEAALSNLKELGSLKGVSFFNTGVSQEQLTDLFSQIHVSQIDVSGEKLPKTRIPWLTHEGLTELSVRRTNFSNPAIEDLPDSLEWLNAGRTRINDDGLDSFVRLKKLKWLNLSRTPTSEAAIEDLRRKMPWCKIEWEPLVNP